jgi:two-component system KDP operon response regulator KdpE
MYSITSNPATEDPRIPTMQELPASQLFKERITLLAVDPNKENCQLLLAILGAEDWNIQGASSLRETTTLLDESVPDLILCERDLPDGNWKDVLHEAEGQRNRPPVVVVSRNADERLWAEVLSLGAYDMLLKPFDRSEVCRMVRCACHRRESARAAVAAA